MLSNEKVIYQKAYKELYKVIEILTQEEIDKIPNYIIENIRREMDNTYEFSIDSTKSILNQNLMPETQALIIELYQKYLAPDEETEKWKKYNQICYEKSENEKRNKYNPDSLFKKKEDRPTPKQNQLIVVEEKSLIQRIIEKIQRIFKFK